MESLVGPEAQLLERVNRVRSDHHLRALHGSQDLAQVARSHADEMAREGYLSHINPRGENPLQRVEAAGIQGFRLLAENIAASDVTGDRISAVVTEWLRSPIHRENLLNPAFNTSGIGIVQAPDGRTVFVELFATF